ncbi:MAG: DUF3572 domain-containing protein [Alphaproteobacteria bacterium]|nr:DUF3572 domain-containing protein [Alphaproteobacteria bacterium]
MKQEQAETLALQALTFLVNDEDRLDRFLALSGLDQNDLRNRIGDPAFLGGVLDHFLGHEPDLLEFATDAEIDPIQVLRARAALPGVNPDW